MSNYITLPLEDYKAVIGLLEGITGLQGEDGKALKWALTLLKNKYMCADVSPSVRQSVFSPSSFEDQLRRAEEQIDLSAFSRYEYKNAANVCHIMAEVYITPAKDPAGNSTLIKIKGSHFPVAVVQGIFAKLTHDHVLMVLSNFNKVTEKIHNTQAYLKTALYNSVLEMDLHYTNQVRHDFGY